MSSGLSSFLGQLADLGFTDFKADASGGISATPPGSASAGAGAGTQMDGHGTSGGSDQVAKPKLVKDCSVSSCIVEGVLYTNNFAIPGNDPVPVKDSDNNPVLGPDNKPLFAPSRANLAAISAQLSRDSFSELYTDEHKFAQAGPWDFQRIKGDDGTIIFTDAYRHFSNVATVKQNAQCAPG